MEKTTIRLSKELVNELNQLKYFYGFKTIEQVIRKQLKKEVSENDRKYMELDKK